MVSSAYHARNYQTFTHALYNLAAQPEYLQPLREEVESVVAEDGWSKASLGKMRKLDSFLKESMRLADGTLSASPSIPPGAHADDCLPSLSRICSLFDPPYAPPTVTMFRKALKDVTLSDGTRIPRGTLVGAASRTAQRDSARYVAPDAFDPFRFARLREGGADAAVKYQLVNTSVDFLTFGHGKHAWCVFSPFSPHLTSPNSSPRILSGSGVDGSCY